MQCNKAIYPHSKYNYVTCTKLVETFADSNPPTPGSGISCSCKGDGSSGDSFSLTCSCTRTSSDSNNATGNGTTGTGTTGTGTTGTGTTGTGTTGTTGTTGNVCPTGVTECFADVMPLATTAQEAMNTAGQGIAGAAKGAAQGIADAAQGIAGAAMPMAAKAAAAVGVSNLMNQANEEDECNKKPLQITVGVLVLILLGLISYIIYQQMKNKQQ